MTIKSFIKLKNLYRLIKSLKIYFKNIAYDSKKDILYNESMFSQKKLDVLEIKKVLKKNQLDYYDPDLSWHYHIFSALKKNKILNILEIGTFDGKFTNFLAKNYINSNIYSCDLPSSDERFISSYNRSNTYIYERMIKNRSVNLDHKNIKFYEINSKNLLNYFPKNKFDLIWIDGDHKDPQVSLDIYNSLKLLKKNGIMCCDDIVKEKFENKYVSNESYLTLKKLESSNKISNIYFLKRARYTNLDFKKYISFSIKL